LLSAYAARKHLRGSPRRIGRSLARRLLAIAYLRAHDNAGARQLLAGLARDFPSNTLFAREIRRLDGEGR
jgi:hypothetical protein